jgi:hypothetical protein
MRGARRWLIVGTAVLAALPAVPAAAATKRRSALPAFDSCGALTRFARAGLARTGGGTGVPPRAIPPAPVALATPVPQPGRPAGSPEVFPVAAPAAGDAAFSPTNTQEPDVDEPDLVKTDGRRMFTVTDRVLRILDVTAATPRLVASLPLEGYGHRLLLRRDTLLVLASAAGYGYAPGGGPAQTIVAPSPGRGRTLVTEIGVADPAAPAVRRTMTVDGDLVDARQHGGTARLVIDSAPDAGATGRSAGAFLGESVLRSRVSGRTYHRRVVRCEQVRRPRSFSGLDVLAIMTVDLDKGLYSLDRDGVMAGAQVVYGSDRSLYVASERYDARVEDERAVPPDRRTEIHRFDVTDPERTTYRSSGSVPGFVLNQYAMSEDGGDLRVATTEQPLWFDGTARQSTSGVSVLRERAGRLETIGRVGGLGEGERIYAVRFIGDRGYLVTFRQTDPLFVVDLSDPRAPRLRGELQIPGYSAYLHPVGDHVLLGVGQDPKGAQASLFDVTDPAHPRRTSQLVFGPGRFGAESDPHAFLFWPPAKLAVLPLTSFGEQRFDGAVAVRTGAALTEAGRLSHPAAEGATPPVARAVVVGDRVLTVSYAGVMASRLSDLGLIAYAAFPASPA